MRVTVSNEGCQPHIFAQIETALSVWEWFIPPWINAIRVTFDPNEAGTVSCRVSEEYRELHFQVLNGWGKVSPDKQDKWVLHELCHIYTDPLFRAFHDLLDAATTEGTPIHKLGVEMARRACERATNDLEGVVYTRMSQAPRLRGPELKGEL